jgi:hypothetical protein
MAPLTVHGAVLRLVWAGIEKQERASALSTPARNRLGKGGQYPAGAPLYQRAAAASN